MPDAPLRAPSAAIDDDGAAAARTIWPLLGLRWTAHVALVASALLPTALGYSVFLTDVPNGVARTAINLRLLSDPAASRFYAFRPVLIPNMAFDSWGLLVAPLLGAGGAAATLIALSVVLLYGAVQWLRVTVIGSTSVLVGAVSVFLIQSGTFRWGLVNFELGSGLTILAIAVTFRHFADRRLVLSPGRLTLRCGLCLASIMCSVFPTALYAAYLAGRLPDRLAGSDRRDTVRILLDTGLPLVPAAVFLAIAQVKPPVGPLDTVWTLYGKLSGLVALFYVRGPALELSLAFSFVAGLLLVAWRCRFSLDRLQRWPMLAIAAIIVLLPSRVMGVNAVDYRLVQMAALVLCGVVRIQRHDLKAWSGGVRALAVAILCLALLRPVVSMRSLEPVVDLRNQIDTVFQSLPDGARLVVLTNLVEFRYHGHRIWHLPLLSLARTGKDVRMPSLFLNFFTHERGEELDHEDWLEVGDARIDDALCTATHALFIGSDDPKSLGLPVLSHDGAAAILEAGRCRTGQP